MGVRGMVNPPLLNQNGLYIFIYVSVSYISLFIKLLCSEKKYNILSIISWFKINTKK